MFNYCHLKILPSFPNEVILAAQTLCFTLPTTTLIIAAAHQVYGNLFQFAVI
jgi:hypothetical protein